jgi:citrate lyase subunit beta-like protein
MCCICTTLWRSSLTRSHTVPGSDPKKLHKALTLRADSLVLDLEDSVLLSQKDVARECVRSTLQSLPVAGLRQGQELAVRINAIGSGLERQDLETILSCPNWSSIVIPKVQSESDVHFVTRMMDSFPGLTDERLELLFFSNLLYSIFSKRKEKKDKKGNGGKCNRRSGLNLIACIETAKGLLNIRSITQSDPRISSLVFAAEDYCADTGILRTRSRKELLYARQKLVATALGFDKQAIDLVCVEYKDPTILQEEAQEGREFGFTGKVSSFSFFSRTCMYFFWKSSLTHGQIVY